MSDIVKRLRVPDEEWMPKGTRVILMYNNTLYEPDNFSLWYGSAIKLEAAAEIERLRARVAVLSDALSGTHTWLGVAIQCPAFRWDADQKQAAQRDYDDARAALEAKP
jgi:hypothetical protein